MENGKIVKGHALLRGLRRVRPGLPHRWSLFWPGFLFYIRLIASAHAFWIMMFPIG
jgi:hypothetical protein